MIQPNFILFFLKKKFLKIGITYLNMGVFLNNSLNYIEAFQNFKNTLNVFKNN